MINISIQLPALWSPQAAQAPLAVPAVMAVRPVQESARNGQSFAGSDPRNQASRQEGRRPEPESVPLLPRKSAQGEDSLTGGTRRSSEAQAERLTQAETQQQAQKAAAEQAAEAARREQRESVLTNVWKASAAVVDRVLGRSESAPGVAAAGGATAQGAAPPMAFNRPTEQLSLPWPVQPQDIALPAAISEGRAAVAYDERGNSSQAPLEPGALISRRV